MIATIKVALPPGCCIKEVLAIDGKETLHLCHILGPIRIEKETGKKRGKNRKKPSGRRTA